jgi:hypothetical protein
MPDNIKRENIRQYFEFGWKLFFRSALFGAVSRVEANPARQ